MGDLGFVSPIKDKHVSGVGYYICSCSNTIKEPLKLFDSDRCPSRFFTCLGPGGLPSEVVFVGCDVSGALR